MKRKRKRKQKEKNAHIYHKVMNKYYPNDSSKITYNDAAILNLTIHTVLHSSHLHGFYVKNVFFSAIFHSYARSFIQSYTTHKYKTYKRGSSFGRLLKNVSLIPKRKRKKRISSVFR